MKRLYIYIYIYIVLASIFVVASCEKPTGEAPKQWHVSTVAGSGAEGYRDATGTAAQFNSPTGIAVSPDGNTLYVADTYNHRIRKMALPSGDVTTVAGSTGGYADATDTEAQFNLPYGIAVSSDGTLYVADVFNNRIRKISSSGKVTTVAGSGAEGYRDAAGTDAQFNLPYGIAVSSDGTLYVTDADNHRIRKIEFR